MARASYRAAAGLKGLRVVGVSVHIGSQITSTEPFRKVLHFIKDVVRDLRADGHRIERIDLGGGLGVRYIDEVPPTPKEYADVVLAETEGLGCEITIEPGRLLVANAGVLVTKVLYEKVAESSTVDPVRIVIVDAGMNDLVRPAMYDSRHASVPVKADGGRHTKADIVGPICESSDRFAQDWPLPPTVPNDLLVIRSAGAYGSSMASTYNSRPLIAEVMVQGREFAVVRPRQTYESLLAGEALPPWLVGGHGVG
jgi:diaminopimelate decarboxylase